MLQNHSFDSLFEVVLADTIESKRIHFNLRYQVYCEELGFEDKHSFPDQMEFDEWDQQHAVHFLVRNRFSGNWLGALRLVYPDQDRLPFETKCQPDNSLTPKDYCRSVEISRLCILKNARGATSLDHIKPNLHTAPTEKNSNNIRYLHKHQLKNRSLMWGLYKAAISYSLNNNIESWYILIAQPLAYCIQRQGFEMQQIGNSSEKSGPRAPFKLSVENLVDNAIWTNDYKRDYLKYSDLITGSSRILRLA